eukprot:6204724-Pleurochrysis_carterae.AAC.4
MRQTQRGGRSGRRGSETRTHREKAAGDVEKEWLAATHGKAAGESKGFRERSQQRRRMAAEKMT